MFEVFKEYVLKQAALTDKEISIIASVALPKKLRKKQYLLQQGDVCRHYSFITKGLMRNYSVDDKGNEHIIRLAMENWWISDRESLLTGAPSRFNIDAIEDSEVLMFAKADMNLLRENVPAFGKLVNEILAKSSVTAENRIHDAISTTAEEKYSRFIHQYPEYALRVPQSMIASYLGIKPETLSRIRHKR